MSPIPPQVPSQSDEESITCRYRWRLRPHRNVPGTNLLSKSIANSPHPDHRQRDLLPPVKPQLGRPAARLRCRPRPAPNVIARKASISLGIAQNKPQHQIAPIWMPLNSHRPTGLRIKFREGSSVIRQIQRTTSLPTRIATLFRLSIPPRPAVAVASVVTGLSPCRCCCSCGRRPLRGRSKDFTRQRFRLTPLSVVL